MSEPTQPTLIPAPVEDRPPADLSPRDRAVWIYEREIRAGADPADYTVTVYRCGAKIGAHGFAQRQFCGTVGVDAATEEEIARVYGAGCYACELRQKGKRGTRMSWAVEIADLAAQPTGGGLTPAPASDVRSELAELRAEIRAMATRPPVPQQGVGLADLLAVLREFKPAAEPLTLKDVIPLLQQKSPVGEVLDAMKSIESMRRVESGGGIEAALGPALVQLVQAMPPRNQPAATASKTPPANPPALPKPAAAPPPELDPAPAVAPDKFEPLAQAIAFGAMHGIDPEDIAPAVAALVPESDPSEANALAQAWIARTPGLSPLAEYVNDVASSVIGPSIAADVMEGAA